MAFRNGSKNRKVVDYVANGGSLTAAEARSRFGVQNFRSQISHIKETVEAYGNWEVTSEPTVTSTARYSRKSL